MTLDLDALDFPENDADAENRFLDFEHFDPFPNIPPALLNSADISKYVRVTGMVHPFERKHDKGKLKPASYEIDFLGEVHFWDDEKKVFAVHKIVPGEPFEIRKNSIVFVSVETVFRLPDYIALRFNLRIKHVHRGLLLGTGPLVDPGFAGRLFIPLHNLTSEPYSIRGGDGFIWVEFTKISPHRHWENKEERCQEYVHFNSKARYLTPQDYLSKITNKGKPAKSGIPDEIRLATETASKAMQRIRQISWGGAISITFAVFAAVYPVVSLVQDGNKYVRESRESSDEATRKVIELSSEVSSLKNQVSLLSEENKKITERLNTTKIIVNKKNVYIQSKCGQSTDVTCESSCQPACRTK